MKVKFVLFERTLEIIPHIIFPINVVCCVGRVEIQIEI